MKPTSLPGSSPHYAVRGAEAERLAARDEGREPWGLWGPYLSERQWGTVREDYSADGDAWEYFPFTHSHLRAYRWGEDGLLGICDEGCRLCFSVAYWNGCDPVLKERPFGLSNPQGNHGEDLKDEFFHLENTPTHSYMSGLYRYPQKEFPYERLIQENAARSRNDPEFELADTGIFDENRFFDVVVSYAKAGPEDICIRICAKNCGPEPATLTLLPTLWFRNTWSWGTPISRPEMHLNSENVLLASCEELPVYHLYSEAADDFLFTGNDTNTARLFGSRDGPPYVKDAFHEAIIHGNRAAVNPARAGTKACAVHQKTLGPGETVTVRLRLAQSHVPDPFGTRFNATFRDRERETGEFYESLTPELPADQARVQRRAFAGLLWSKKFYYYPVARWLAGDPDQPPPPPSRKTGRNAHWKEMHAHDIFAMPDCWEYPYFCAWDLMFHSFVHALIDPATAKRQSMILHGERYTSPSAQQPAYEWEFSDLNPPIGAWACWRIYTMDRTRCGVGDRGFLTRAFHKLLINYAWWANRVDQGGDNIFEGGFLGLDNIGVFDRRDPLPDGSRIAQSDGTAWMATFALNMLNMAVELSRDEPAYEDIADKFLSDFIYLSATVNAATETGYSLWDEEDGFYYDVLKRPDGSTCALKTRSIAGLTPLFAVESFNEEAVKCLPLLRRRIAWFRSHRPHLIGQLRHISSVHLGRQMISLVPPERLRRICERLFDEKEFLSPFGIRSLSRVYDEHPYAFAEGDQTSTLAYSPGESPVNMFGGNSNWRGPVWIPMNYLLIEALQKFGHYFRDSFKVEFPTGSGQKYSLWEVSLELEKRLASLFLADPNGQRAFRGPSPRTGNNPLWNDQILFHEYFHGDNGKGLGASHQTGWSALVAKMIQQLHTFRKS